MSAVETKPGGLIAPKLLTELQEKVDVLVGVPYLFSRVGFGDELTIHFGFERKHTHPKLADKVRGTHVLSVRGSAWMLRSGVNPVIVECGIIPTPLSSEPQPFNVTALESGALIGRSATVVKATPIPVLPMNSVGLILELSEGSAFTIIPTPPSDGDDGPEPSDWELLTSDEWVRVGPGSKVRIDALK